MDGASCGAATTSTADRIVTAGTVSGNETFALDLDGRAFAPGATTEPSGTSEIEFRVDLGAGTDTLFVAGSAAVDTITFGSAGVDLTGDANADLLASGTEIYIVNVGDGGDVVSAGGGGGTGSAFSTR
jgi:hypothetical protein